ncbi:hypothetical protein THRCLA_03722 [Thraustotheca clavata]|uniref:PH domain-containing protein n=1 Tax=Thraustotheca clavata TaxID=74557 RepID=A0A1W0A1C8_9STRA|nr:hypothetical protein THRCLA_03722 [Thraustotheca clavata]
MLSSPPRINASSLYSTGKRTALRTPGKSPSNRPSLPSSPLKLVRQHGYLATKKMLRGFVSQYYCLNAQSSKLYVFDDYSEFNHWNQQGQPKHMTTKTYQGHTIACGPKKIIQLDALDDYDALHPAMVQFYYKITLSVYKKMNSSKMEKLVLLAETLDAYHEWIDAFEDVLSSSEENSGTQIRSNRQRHTTASRDESTYSSLNSDTASSLLHPISGTRPSSKSDTYPAGKTNAGSFINTPMRPSSGSQSLSRRYSEIFNRADLRQNHDAESSPQGVPLAVRGRTQSALSMRFGATKDESSFLSNQVPLSSSTSFLSSQGPPASTRNVLLFVSTNGSTVGVSEAKIQQARDELAKLLVLPGNYQPERGLDSFMDSRTFWLHGPPDYALTDVAFLRGRTRNHGITSVAYDIETTLRVFSMELTHKARLSQWTSVATTFWLQVNEYPAVSYHQLPEVRHALMGLVYLHPTPESPTSAPASPLVESSSVLAEALTDGFPMEVLEVYTSDPSNIYFAWRHWGAFTGSYMGRRGDGSIVEIKGFGRLAKDTGTGKLLSLHLFCNPEPLLKQLRSKWAPQGPAIPTTSTQRRSRGDSESVHMDFPRRRRPSANSLDLTYDLQGLNKSG